MKKQPVSITLDANILEEIETLADLVGVSRSAVINAAVVHTLENVCFDAFLVTIKELNRKDQ